MKPIWMYLDEAINKGIVKNDSELAAKLGITRASVSAWRSGKTAPNDEQAIALAELIGKPVIELMAEAAAHRAKTPKSRTYWEQIAKYSADYASAAGIVLITLACALPSPEARASLSFDVYKVNIIVRRIARKSLIALDKIKRRLIEVIVERTPPVGILRVT